MAFKTASKNLVMYSKLDIADPSSVEDLASSVKEKHGAVDVLINNAGVNVDDEYSAKNVKVTLDTNVRGTLQVSMLSLILDIENWSETGDSICKCWSSHSEKVLTIFSFSSSLKNPWHRLGNLLLQFVSSVGIVQRLNPNYNPATDVSSIQTALE